MTLKILSAVLLGAFLLPSLTLAQSATCAPTVKSHHKNKIHCGEFGNLKRPAFLSSSTVIDQDTCTNNCINSLRNPRCRSFSYDQETMECRLYTQTLVQQRYVNRTVPEGFVYYNRNCYTTKCPRCKPSKPTGDFVVNRDFECRLNPWISFTTNYATYTLGTPAEGTKAYVVNTAEDFVNGMTGVALNMLYQLLSLEPNTQYTTTFDAYFGTVDDFITASLNPVGIPIGATPSTTQTFQTYTVPLTYYSRPYLFLEFYPFAAGATIALDNVSVQLAAPIDCTIGLPPVGDFVVNGGFECTFAGWDAYKSNGVSVLIATPGYEGDYAVEVRVTDAFDPSQNQFASVQIYTTITVPEVDFVITVYVLNVIDGNTISIAYSDAFATLDLANSPKYQPYSTTLSGTGSETSLTIYVNVRSPSQSIFIDSISAQVVVS